MAEEATVLFKELESHIAFYRRRHEIEFEYAEALRKLATRDQQGQEDRSHAPSSWRTSALARANTLQEAHAHAQLAMAIEDIVKKLNTFREDKERMRRRVKEDSRTTKEAHVEYLAVVDKLKRAYERKVEDVQSHERDELEREAHDKDHWPPEHWTSSETSHRQSSEGTRDRKGSVGTRTPAGASTDGQGQTPLSSSPGTVTAAPTPPPVFVSGAGTTGPAGSSTYREGPGGQKGNVFDAIAKRDWSNDKHRINSIARAVGNLAKGDGGGGGGSSGGVGRSHTTRARAASTRLKRDAEQADRDYRDGVWRCETLRLQRARVKVSARNFVVDMAGELSSTLRQILDTQSQTLHKVADAVHQVGDAFGEASKQLVPNKDADDFSKTLPPPSPEPRIFYKNYFFGQCVDLLFGVSLMDYHATHPDTLVPLILKRCIAFIDSHGLKSEGIYRISGKQTTVQQLVHVIERNEKDFEFDEREEPATVASLLKLYLRQLPQPLFPFSLSDRLSFSSDVLKDYQAATSSLQRRIRRLAPPNQATLKELLEHLARVAQNESVNKMTASNLSLIFSAVIFGDDVASLETARSSTKDLVLEVLISQHDAMFEGLPAEATRPRSRGASPVGLSRSRGTSLSSTGAASPQMNPHTQPGQMHTPHPLSFPALGAGQEPSQLKLPPRPGVSAAGAVSDPNVPTLPHRVEGLGGSAPSPDSVYNLYSRSQDSFLPHENQVLSPRPQPFQGAAVVGPNLSTPSPPLSAAGGRRIPEGSSGSER